MKITSCVPLPGAGVLARYGALVAVSDAHGPSPDLLLSVLAEVAAACGDGRELVRVAARAALGCPGQPSWACAGVTAGGGLAVLVHGHAVATVRPAGGPPVTLTASDSVIPVSRTFAGPSLTLELAVGETAPPDARCWLGGGVVPGSGLAVTVAADGSAPAGGGAPVAAVAAADDDPWLTRQPSGGPVGWHPPTVITPPPAVVSPAAVPPGPVPPVVPAPGQAAGEDSGPADDPPRPVLVDGVLCDRGHFTDPGARTCRDCGSGIGHQPGTAQRRPRPPLGELVLDDGRRVTLDGNYVLGREPALDGDVIAGRARPVRVCDPEGTVSRLHLKVSLVGWQVEVCDLGSANGSVIQSPGGERALAPFEPAVVEPGTWIGIGQRSMHYLAYQGVRP